MSLMRMTAQRSIYRLIKKVVGTICSPIAGGILGVAYRHWRTSRPPLLKIPLPSKIPPSRTHRSSSLRRPAPMATSRPPLKPVPKPRLAHAPPHAPPIPVSLGLSKHSFVHGPRRIPNFDRSL